MKRFPFDEYIPIPDKEPQVTVHIRDMLRDQAEGRLRPEDFTADYWRTAILPNRASLQAEMKSLGELVSITLVEREEIKNLRSYRHRLELANARVILHLVLDTQNRVTASSADALEWSASTKSSKRSP